MNFIDTHTHLYDEAFVTDASDAVERAVRAGISGMILPDIDSSSRAAMFSIAEKHPGTLFPCIGLHPTSVDMGWEKEIEKVADGLAGNKVYAIGETGMDCYWSKDFIKEQQTALKLQLEMAAKADLPVIIHSREATELIFGVLMDCRHLGLRGVFHAFSGSIESFRRLQTLGDWYVGIGGVLTYRNASIADTVKQIPLDRIILETDSPYLTPVPYRGKRNESSYIPHIAEKLAVQKGTEILEIAEVTTMNARRLFRI